MILLGIQKYPASNKRKFTMSGIQLKITRHTKKQENTTHNEKECRSTEIDPELRWILELIDKDGWSRF